MKTILILVSLFIATAASAAPEIACYGVSKGQYFGFTIESTQSATFEGLLFPMVDQEDTAHFDCSRQGKYIICQGLKSAGWHLKIEPTPHGDFASVYSEEFEGVSTRVMSLDCRPL